MGNGEFYPWPSWEDYLLMLILGSSVAAVIWLVADWFEAGCPRNPEGD